MERIAVVMGLNALGGVKSVVMNYYRGIDRTKYQFDFFIDKNSPIKDYSDMTSLGGRVYEIPSIKNPVAYILSLRSVFKTNRYNIVHGYVNTLNIFCMFAAFLAGVPIRIAENLSTAHKGEKKTIVKNILKLVGRAFSTHIAANSLLAGEWMYGKGAMGECVILPNAVDTKEFRYDEGLRATTRKELGLKDELVIGHIGRFEYQKNHDFLIDVFAQIKKKRLSSKLMLIGYGSLKEKIEKKIKSLGLEDDVIDLGSQSDNCKFYNAMDVFVMTSFYEGLPVVGIEAQACGLPCLFSAEITKETQVHDNVRFVALEESAAAWADHVLEIAKCDREKALETFALSDNGMDKAALKLQNWYDDLIGIR